MEKHTTSDPVEPFSEQRREHQQVVVMDPDVVIVTCRLLHKLISEALQLYGQIQSQYQAPPFCKKKLCLQ